MVKNPFANAGDVIDGGLIPGLGRYPGGGYGNPLQYSCLENPMDRGAWWATVHRVLRSFNGPEPGSLESMIRKVKERKRLIFLGLHRKPIKPLHGACSVHEGLRRPLNEVKVQDTFSRGSQKPGQESELREPLRSRESA